MEHKILDKIVGIPFTANDYVKQEYTKNQIVLHHTVSDDNPKAVAKYWASRVPRIATCIIIGRDGTPYQLFSSRYWGGHLGMSLKHFAQMETRYKNLNKTSIGVELCSWGGLQQIDGSIYTCYGNKLKKDNSIIKLDIPYRGYTYFHSYTKEQIESLKQLLIYWNEIYNIPLDYKENMWEFNKNALSGESGIWAHTSFRPDKSDVFPQKELIEMLKNLKDG